MKTHWLMLLWCTMAATAAQIKHNSITGITADTQPLQPLTLVANDVTKSAQVAGLRRKWMETICETETDEYVWRGGDARKTNTKNSNFRPNEYTSWKKQGCGWNTTGQRSVVGQRGVGVTFRAAINNHMLPHRHAAPGPSDTQRGLTPQLRDCLVWVRAAGSRAGRAAFCPRPCRRKIVINASFLERRVFRFLMWRLMNAQ